MSVTSETIDSLNFVLDAQRVYTELGSVKKLTRLLDDPPKLLNQTDIILRLHDRNGKKKRCRIYIFDKYFIVGAEVKNKKKTLSQIGGESVSDGTSSSGKVVWFGDKNSGEMTSEEAKSENSTDNTETVNTGPGAVDAESDSDSDGEDNLAAYRALTAAEAQEKKDKQEFKVKMFVDLAASKPKMVKKDDELAIFFTYVTKTQEEIAPGEYRCDTTVDSAEVWFEDPAKAKNVMGIVQDAIDVLMENILKQKFSKEAKPINVVENADTESQDDATDSTDGSVSSKGNSPSTKGARKSGSRSNRPDRTSSGGSSNVGTKKLRKFAKSMETMKKTKAFATSTKQRLAENGGSAPAGVFSFDGLKERYKNLTPDIALHDEGMDAEFTVIFKNPTMGFAMSSSPKIGPFVCRLVADGLAEQSQVTLGDRVMAINDTPIPLTMQWQECVALIKKYGPPLKITFLRKQKNEIIRQQLVEEAEAKVMAAVEDDNKAAESAVDEEEVKEEEKAEDPEKVVPVASTESAAIIASSDKEKRRTMLETIELRRKTATSDGKTPAYTIKRKEGKAKRRFAKKRDMYQTEKYNVSKTTDITSFRKNKNDLLQQIEDVDSLFATLFDIYKNNQREKTCLFALNEIYVTERKYLSTLGLIRDVQKMLESAYVTVLCKDRKTASAFCEHRRPLRFCSQPSKDLEPLVETSTLNNIFMNIKPMMQAHFFLEKNLRDKLCMLFEGLKNGVSVEIDELLNVFVLAFAEIAPFLQMYWVYCERYQRSVSKYTELTGSNPEVAKQVGPYEKRISGNFISALVAPVQRITKYPLLFYTLKKYVEDYVQDQKNRGTLGKDKLSTSELMLDQLDKAAKIAHNVATKVNVLVGRTEKLGRMAEIFQKFGGKNSIPDFLQPFRWFEENCYIAYEDVSDNSELKGSSVLFVFNDMLMIAHITSGEGKGWFRSKSGSLGKLNLSNKLKKISLGKERETSVSPKTSNGGKLSQLGLTRHKDFGRKTNTDTNAPESKDSVTSKEAEVAQYNSEFYDCAIRVPLLHVLPEKLVKKEKTLEGEEMFGIELWFSEKQKHETAVKSYNIWIGKSEERDKLVELLKTLIEEQRKNKSSMQHATDKSAVETKTKKKKFATKIAESKAKSLAESKNKKTIVGDDGSKRVVSK